MEKSIIAGFVEYETNRTYFSSTKELNELLYECKYDKHLSGGIGVQIVNEFVDINEYVYIIKKYYNIILGFSHYECNDVKLLQAYEDKINKINEEKVKDFPNFIEYCRNNGIKVNGNEKPEEFKLKTSIYSLGIY